MVANKIYKIWGVSLYDIPHVKRDKIDKVKYKVFIGYNNIFKIYKISKWQKKIIVSKDVKIHKKSTIKLGATNKEVMPKKNSHFLDGDLNGLLLRENRFFSL